MNPRTLRRLRYKIDNLPHDATQAECVDVQREVFAKMNKGYLNAYQADRLTERLRPHMRDAIRREGGIVL